VIEIRPPRPEEIEEIAKLWARSFEPTAEEMAGDSFVRLGRWRTTAVAPHVWRLAHRQYIEHRLRHDLVMVADVAGGLAGFVAFSLPEGDRQVLTIHYLYVLRPGRRKGIGRRLYDAARKYGGEAPMRTTHTTRHWARFLEGIGA
jgi:GNAT superfamily N-acetyltransferase